MKIQPVIYKCPNCSSLIRGMKYLSGNTIGGVLYSDSYLEAPMNIPEGSNYLGCPQCQKVFLKNDLPMVKEYAVGDEELTEWEQVLAPLDWFATLKILLENPKFNEPSNQKKFTLWYLWYFNHKLSPLEKQNEIKNGNYKKYTDRLIDILEQEQDGQEPLVLTIEILRERGDFDKALELINQLDLKAFPPIFQLVLTENKNKALQKDPEVFLVARN